MQENLITALCTLIGALQGLTNTPEENVTPPLACRAEATTTQQVLLTPQPTELLYGTALRYNVPFYSQFDDISSAIWQPRGCGIASLAMVINYHKQNATVVDTLLLQGIENGSYIDNVGWIHRDLAELARSYGVWGTSHDLSYASEGEAFTSLENALATGPVIASVHYTFDYTNPIPHLVVITGIDGDIIHHNDPASRTGSDTVSKQQFLSSWKKRYIAFE